MYETIAYVDHGNLAASAFATRNPVPQWRDIGDIIQSKEFDAVAATADVAFVGAPCADHSILNPDRQPDSERGRLIFKALKNVQQLFTKVGVFEVVDGFLSTPQLENSAPKQHQLTLTLWSPYA
jgi:site-specific DNA-cytosine methylase